MKEPKNLRTVTFAETWQEANPAEKLVQKQCAFTLGWMNQFLPNSVRAGLYALHPPEYIHSGFIYRTCDLCYESDI